MSSQSRSLPADDVLEAAIAFAAHAHRAQRRKGTSSHYVWHPFAVARLLEETGAPAHAVIAGVLHDTVEDTGTPIEEIRSRFGDDVARIVSAETEPDKSLSWEKRKAQTIERLRAAPVEVKLVAAADKLDNLRSIRAELAEVGERAFARFKRGRPEQEWYYRSVLQSLRSGDGPAAEHPIVRMLAEEVALVFGRPEPGAASRGGAGAAPGGVGL